jgi:hypothetical protein
MMRIISNVVKCGELGLVHVSGMSGIFHLTKVASKLEPILF